MNKVKGRDVFADRLSAMKDSFSVAQKQASVMEEDGIFPEGQYIGKVTAKLKETKSGNLAILWTFVPTEGDLVGVPCWDNTVIEHEDPSVVVRNQRTTIKRMNMLGYDNFTVEDIPEVLEKITVASPTCEFVVSHAPAKDGSRIFTNVKVIGLIEEGQEAQIEAEPEPEQEKPKFPNGKRTISSTKEKESADLSNQLSDFCMAVGIDVDSDDTQDSLVEKIRNFTEENKSGFPKEALTDEDITLLNAVGLENTIVDPEPEKPKAVTRKIALAPSKNIKSKGRK